MLFTGRVNPKPPRKRRRIDAIFPASDSPATQRRYTELAACLDAQPAAWLVRIILAHFHAAHFGLNHTQEHLALQRLSIFTADGAASTAADTFRTFAQLEVTAQRTWLQRCLATEFVRLHQDHKQVGSRLMGGLVQRLYAYQAEDASVSGPNDQALVLWSLAFDVIITPLWLEDFIIDGLHLLAALTTPRAEMLMWPFRSDLQASERWEQTLRAWSEIRLFLTTDPSMPHPLTTLLRLILHDVVKQAQTRLLLPRTSGSVSYEQQQVVKASDLLPELIQIVLSYLPEMTPFCFVTPGPTTVAAVTSRSIEISCRDNKAHHRRCFLYVTAERRWQVLLTVQGSLIPVKVSAAFATFDPAQAYKVEPNKHIHHIYNQQRQSMSLILHPQEEGGRLEGKGVDVCHTASDDVLLCLTSSQDLWAATRYRPREYSFSLERISCGLFQEGIRGSGLLVQNESECVIRASEMSGLWLCQLVHAGCWASAANEERCQGEQVMRLTALMRRAGPEVPAPAPRRALDPYRPPLWGY